MRTTNLPVSDVLFGQIRSGILALLYGRPDQSFYLRQIARHIGASTGAVQRDITQLSKAGLINRIPLGSQVFYQANSNSPIFAEMRGLVTKTVGVHDRLLFLLAPYGRKIKVGFVYGSVARHEETAQSDVDLMIVGNISLEELMPTFAKAQVVTGTGNQCNRLFAEGIPFQGGWRESFSAECAQGQEAFSDWKRR